MLMDSRNRPFDGYNSGDEFWRDNVKKYGLVEACGICNRYLAMNLKRELSEDESQFCREIFAAMYEATTKEIIPERLVYPYDYKTADDRMETSYFRKNMELNKECVNAIDEAIKASNYATNHYNLELAAMSVISGHGFERVNAILANHIQRHEYDGRYSYDNKKWVKDFTFPDKTFMVIDSHPILIDSFTDYARKLFTNLGAERFMLPGNDEQVEDVQGFKIIRSIMVDKNQGYVIGYNPDAVDPYVCWQFYIRDGERNYNWGIYGDEQAAINGYKARLFVSHN
jgi:hypothetical protein